jgi:hypothetical protein
MYPDYAISSIRTLVNRDVVSLFTNVPILESLELPGRHLTQEIVTLFKHVLTSTYFVCNGQHYKQTDGLAMGCPLSPVIANFFMEDSEESFGQSHTQALLLISLC